MNTDVSQQHQTQTECTSNKSYAYSVLDMDREGQQYGNRDRGRLKSYWHLRKYNYEQQGYEKYTPISRHFTTLRHWP